MKKKVNKADEENFEIEEIKDGSDMSNIEEDDDIEEDLIIQMPRRKDDVRVENAVKMPINKKPSLVKKKKNRREHGDYIINLGSKPIIIVGVGNDTDNKTGVKVIRLGIVGSDDYGAGIEPIYDIPDKQLDGSMSYRTFLKNGKIKEINSEQKDEILKRVSMMRENLKAQGFEINDAYQMMQAQMMINPMAFNKKFRHLREEEKMIYSQRQRDTLLNMELGRSGLFDKNDVLRVDGYKFGHERMSSFYKIR